MTQFIFIEDRGVETGHGWRDTKHRFILEDADGSVRVEIFCEQDEEFMKSPRPYAECSYAWICPREYWEKNHHLDDHTRTKTVLNFHPDFKGISDMESHFEFRMTPKEMRQHLKRLGMIEVKR